LRHFLAIRILLLGVVGLLGCGAGAGLRQPPPTPDVSQLQSSAALGAGDVVEVRVYQEKELSGLYRLGSDGTIRVPLVGELKAEGKSPNALATELTQRLKDGYIRDPQVTVLIKEFNSKKVVVVGNVRKPGTFRYEDDMTVVQAVSLAGGLTKLAEKNGLILTRQVEGAEKKFVVPFENIGLGRAPNVTLQPGDIVFVPESWL
jgi:polysaccharide export outer membrane protein